MIVVINPFILRQTEDSPFSHFEGSWEDLRDRTQRALEAGSFKPGYRDGVLEVVLSPEGIFSSVTILKEGDLLVGQFQSRREGEAPRKEIRAKGTSKAPAQEASMILYRADVLAEGGDNTLPADSGGWEMISLNAAPMKGHMPIEPNVLMHNHFGSDGGTATGLSDAEFVRLLRESFLYWRDKALAC